MGPDVTVKRIDEPVGIPPRRNEDGMSTATPEQVIESIVTGINSGNLESLMPLYESEAAFATEPGASLTAHPASAKPCPASSRCRASSTSR
jgi:hypothetical protein